MSYQMIRVAEAKGITTITMAREPVMNALNAAMRIELTQALRAAAAEARVVVLTGEGRAFCSGQDLTGGRGLPGSEVERTLREEYEPMVAAITDCPVPVIAAVNGAAAGAGANLALVCDVVIACESAFFAQVFTRIGLMPDAGGTWALPRHVGLARAMGMALFADRIPARQAADWGLIWEAVPDADFAATVAARAEALATGPTVAIRAIKTAMRASLSNDLPAQLALEARLQGECGNTRDFREGVTAFLEKRAPSFYGV